MKHNRDWRAEAACRYEDARLFTNPDVADLKPDQGSLRKERDRRKLLALAICSQCPVRSDCLKDASDNGGAGIRAGMTEYDRQRGRWA